MYAYIYVAPVNMYSEQPTDKLSSIALMFCFVLRVEVLAMCFDEDVEAKLSMAR